MKPEDPVDKTGSGSRANPGVTAVKVKAIKNAVKKESFLSRFIVGSFSMFLSELASSNLAPWDGIWPKPL